MKKSHGSTDLSDLSLNPFNFQVPQWAVPGLAMLCAQTLLLLCYSDPPTQLACLVPFPSSVLGLEETRRKHWFPWMICLLHASIGLFVSDNRLVIIWNRPHIRKICCELKLHVLNPSENIVLALVECLTAPAEMKTLSYSLCLVEHGVPCFSEPWGMKLGRSNQFLIGIKQ